MAHNNNDIDWWKKPEHLKEKPKARGGESTTANKTKSKSKRSTSPKSDSLSHSEAAKKVAINIAAIAIMMIAGGVVAHFVLLSTTRHDARCVVPQFESLTLSEAQNVAQESDLRIIINDSIYSPTLKRGIILDQLPEAGSVVKPGRTIYITINATQRKMVDVPYVAGRSLRQAKNMLEVAGLSIEELIYEPDLATNYILAQSINGHKIEAKDSIKAPDGSGVTLHVGVGEGLNKTTMPDLLGVGVDMAKNAIWSAGLNVGTITLDRDIDISNRAQAIIYSQSIEANGECELGTRVALALTLSRHKVDSVRMAIQRDKIFEAESKLFEEAIDSMISVEFDTAEVKEPIKKPAKRVEMEDLFN